MNTKIYVGNILYEVTDQDLRDLFSPYGEVAAAEVVRYQKSKRSKGFGFVRMATVEQAQAAVQALNDQDYRGRKLFLDFARSEDPTPDVREKQMQTAQQAAEKPPQTYTPMEQPPMQAEEVHPEVALDTSHELDAGTIDALLPDGEQMPAEQPQPEAGVEAPAPEPEAPAAEQPMGSFGTIFSNSPSKNGDEA